MFRRLAQVWILFWGKAIWLHLFLRGKGLPTWSTPCELSDFSVRSKELPGLWNQNYIAFCYRTIAFCYRFELMEISLWIISVCASRNRGKSISHITARERIPVACFRTSIWQTCNFLANLHFPNFLPQVWSRLFDTRAGVSPMNAALP